MIDDKTYDHWNEVKKELNKSERKPIYKTGQIWWCSIGQNIGSESYGKGVKFARPVLVLKKLSSEIFIGIPLTTKEKTGTWFVQFKHRKKAIIAMLYQVRLFDIRRSLDHEGQIDTRDFIRIKKSFKKLLEL